MSREALKTLGIYSSETLSGWAKRHGLLGVFLHYTPAQGFYPAHWQAIRPGYKTGASGPAWQRGNKTWTCRDATEKNEMEERAKTWASGVFDVRGWVRIEGLGGDLFPDTVAAELKRYIPDLQTYRKRQRHPQKRLTRRK